MSSLIIKRSKLEICHTPGKNISVADMLSRSFTKTQIQINQLKHNQLSTQIDLAILQDITPKPVHYLIKHEVLPHQKHDSHPSLAEHGTDQFSVRINDKSNDIVAKRLTSFSLTPFQTKIKTFKTPIKSNNKVLHQQSLLLDGTDITSDDEDPINSRIPKPNSKFTTDNTLHYYTFSTITKPKSTFTPELTSAIDVLTNSKLSTHCSKSIPFYDISFFKNNNYFEGFFLPGDYTLDHKTIQQQQTQDTILRTVDSWLSRNEKPDFLTPLITGTLFLHAN